MQNVGHNCIDLFLVVVTGVTSTAQASRLVTGPKHQQKELQPDVDINLTSKIPQRVPLHPETFNKTENLRF